MSLDNISQINTTILQIACNLWTNTKPICLLWLRDAFYEISRLDFLTKTVEQFPLLKQ